MGRNQEGILNNSPLSTLLQASSATLYISNKKNGTRGQLIHYEAILASMGCPIKSIRTCAPHSPAHHTNMYTKLSAYNGPKATTSKHIMSSAINKQVKATVKFLNIKHSSFLPAYQQSLALRWRCHNHETKCH